MRSEERQGRCKHPGLFSRNVKWKYDDSKKFKEIVQLKWKKESIKLCVCVCVSYFDTSHILSEDEMWHFDLSRRGENSLLSRKSHSSNTSL